MRSPKTCLSWLLSGLFFASAAVAAPPGLSGRGLTWDSPRMAKLQAEWSSLADERTPAGQQPDDLGERQCALLDKRLSLDDARDLAGSCWAIPATERGRSHFQNDVLAHVFRALVKLGDRQALTDMLSVRCPHLVAYDATVEGWLGCYAPRVRDPITILGDAYWKCADRQVRRIIACALRRGFADLGVRGKEDADFVRSAMQWYQNNKDRVKPNPRYVGNQQACPIGETPDDKDVPWLNGEDHPWGPPGKRVDLLFINK